MSAHLPAPRRRSRPPGSTPAKASRGRPRKVDAAGASMRDRILDAAEHCFSTQGFHGTSVAEVAARVGMSSGNLYNHFGTKQDLFVATLVRLNTLYSDVTSLHARTLRTMDFPADLEKLGAAIGASFERFEPMIRLMYVDVLEFQGEHLAPIYQGMKDRFDQIFAERFAAKRKQGAFNEKADPTIAVMMAYMCFTYYFTIERMIGVKGHMGLEDRQILREFSDVVRYGVLARSNA